MCSVSVYVVVTFTPLLTTCCLCRAISVFQRTLNSSNLLCIAIIYTALNYRGKLLLTHLLRYYRLLASLCQFLLWLHWHWVTFAVGGPVLAVQVPTQSHCAGDPRNLIYSSAQHSRLQLLSINQSKFIFQAMTKNCNTIKVTALERLPEKHYAH